MKFFMAIGCAALLLSGCAGYAPATDEQRKVEKVFDVPGMSKAQIHQGIKVWIAENFVSAKAVLEHDNQEDGILIGNTVMKWPCDGIDCVAKHEWRMSATYRFDVKDGRFRVQMMNIRKSWPAKYPYSGADMPIESVDDFDLARKTMAEVGEKASATINKNAAAKSNW